MSSNSIKWNSLLHLIGFFCFSFHLLSAQDQRVADSLAILYDENHLMGTEKLKLLKELAKNEINDLDKALGFADELIELSMDLKDDNYLYLGHLWKGYKYLDLARLEDALNEFITCSDIAITLNNPNKEGVANITIADVHNRLGNFPTAEEYYGKAIEIFEQSHDSISYAAALLNLGETYFKDKKFDKALVIFDKSGKIYRDLKDRSGTAYYLGNSGMVLVEKFEDSIAEENLLKAINILEKRKDYYPICTYLLYLSEIYSRKGDMSTAFDYANKSLELAQEHKLNEQINDANLKLSELYDSTGNIEVASEYRKKYIDYINSSFNLEANNTADLLRYHEVSQKQAETDLANQKVKTQRIIVYATASTLLFIVWLAVVLYRKNKFVRATNKIISSEKQRSDNLLLNILPKDTAQELKDRGKVKAQRFESVSILFSDFEGFTRYAEVLPPEEVVKAVDYYFSKFDEIIEKYGIEKIKTVGDAYMCAGGLPMPTQDHAYKIVLAALDIIRFVNEVKIDNQQKTKFDIRIGINTGPVVAGVVGNKKFAYDIWGDSVNIASRMESSSEPGKINISEDTYQLVKDKFNCEFRGEIDVKNRGFLKMYFVENLK